MNAEQLELREAVALDLGSLELDAETVRPALAKALRDSKTEVRRAAMKSIQRFGPQGAIFVPDIIMLAEKKENLRSVERMLRRFERAGRMCGRCRSSSSNWSTTRTRCDCWPSSSSRSPVRTPKEAIPALERMREDPSAEVRKQAQAASERIKSNAESGQEKGTARKTAAS